MSIPASGDDPLRALVASVVRDLVTEMVADSVRQETRETGSAARPTAAPPPSPEPAPREQAPGAEYRTEPDLRNRVEQVRIADSSELNSFARHLLTLFENPKNREDLRAGRLTFRLQAAPGADPRRGPARRIERGAVTEQVVRAAAESGERLVLSRRAVLTPLARERARALGVEIEKER